MANTGATIVDRVLPDVRVRQFVLSLPFELRRLAAFRADVLTALGRIVVDAIFASYRARAKAAGLEGTECGAVNFVQRFGGSVNLHVHFHVVVLDGVYTRDAEGGVVFHPTGPPARDELTAIVQRVQKRAEAWLRRRGYLDARALEDRSNEPPAQTALDACASIAMARGKVATLTSADEPEDAPQPPVGRVGAAVEVDGYNLHAAVVIEAGDDVGREKLVRYAARPPIALGRLRRLPGGRVAYRLKYVGRGRSKDRVMAPIEFLARLAALIAPPRYPLVRYAGALGPRSSWRKDVVPRPRERLPTCPGQATARSSNASPPAPRASVDGSASAHAGAPAPTGANVPVVARVPQSRESASALTVMIGKPGRATRGDVTTMQAPAVVALAPNVLSLRHWDRLLGGVLYAVTPRIDWACLLRRTFDVDILECPKCRGRLAVIAAITEKPSVRRVLVHLGLPTEAPVLARARDPTDEVDDEVEPRGQLELGLA